MEWIYWVTVVCYLAMCGMFVSLYAWSDINCVWPPCVSELIEVHKTLAIIFFGFSCGLVWLNLVLMGILRGSDLLVALATMVFLSVMGVLAFDVNAHRGAHYTFVANYMLSSVAYVNVALTEENQLFSYAVNICTFLFAFAVATAAQHAKWNTVLKYTYTIIECTWITSFLCYALIDAGSYRTQYNQLLETNAVILKQYAERIPPPSIASPHPYK